jgi:hypothetical protein
MKLPNADMAFVEQTTICAYLLSDQHRYGATKARYFARFGFTLESWEELAVALCEIGRQNEVLKVKETGFGPRYEVEGELNAPDGRRPHVRTVWQLDKGQSAPRLITAHPVEE